MSECGSLTSFGFHIKSKHYDLSDFYEQKCLSFVKVSFGDSTISKKHFAISLQNYGICMTLVSSYLMRILTF